MDIIKMHGKSIAWSIENEKGTCCERRRTVDIPLPCACVVHNDPCLCTGLVEVSKWLIIPGIQLNESNWKKVVLTHFKLISTIIHYSIVDQILCRWFIIT